jgi:hypothetical protein
MLTNKLKQILKRTAKAILQKARESAIKVNVVKQSFSTLVKRERS